MALAACLFDGGCARLQSFRKDSGTPFGTPLSSRVDGKPTPGGDLYADAFHKGQAAPTAVAQRTPQAPPEVKPAETAKPEASTELALNAPTASPPAGRTSVTLEPPVPLQTAEPPATAVAARATPARWQSRPESAPAASAATTSTSTLAAAAPSTPTTPTVEALVAETRSKLDRLMSYQVKLNRQERVGASLQPVEEVLVSIRRTPRAVRLEWPSGPHKGREVLFSSSENGGLMHVNMADSVVPMPRLAIAPDSPMVMSSSRHPITEAGFDTIINNLNLALTRSKAGDHSGGKVSYAGMQQPQGLDRMCHKIVRVTPAGETWAIYLDPRTKFPAMVQGNSGNGDLLERYIFRDVKPNVPELAKADAFDPNKRWGEAPGLLSRLARSTVAVSKPAADSATR